MRGDSVRDFYAKTLALLGLGVLAGTGALVDYWPASKVNLPAADPVLVMPDVAWTAIPAAPVRPVELRLAPLVTPMTAAPAPILPVPEPVFVMPALQRVVLSAPPADVLTPVVWTASQPHTEIALSDYQPFEPVAVLASSDLREPVASLATTSSPDDDDWWITAAAKRTGSSIARTGVRTGASFVGLVRAVNRAVRRALPN
ncbi:MAG: hypothetical protein IT184_14915 [Acidobacteria bacterium]|nr:hypothetical protein [Acidobacteriota bacterium]